VQRKRPNLQWLFWQSMAFVVLTGTTLCLATFAAAFQQPPAQPVETAAKGAAPAPPPATAQAPAPPQSPPPGAPQAPTPGQIEPGPEKVHIIVGHSFLIRTATRIRRVLTGNPAVIETVLTSPRELVITAKDPGSSSLMLWDESGQNRSLDVYADLDVTDLRNTLDQTFPNTGVDVQSEAGRVILVGTVPSEAVAVQMAKMASTFSKDVVNGLQVSVPPREKQVMLKVRFAEADRTRLSQFGFNLFSTGATNTLGVISTQQFGPLSYQAQNSTTGSANTGLSQFTLSSLLNIFLFRPDINLGATISILEQKNILQILSEPNLMALSGQPARFLAGGEFPYPVVQGGGAGTVPTVTIQFRPYGVKLEFVATIEPDNTVRLKVAPEVSTLDYSNALTISGFVVPAISTRRAETEIDLKDGQSFGIAGLLDNRTTVELSKIPGIGDVPILGQLFRSRSTNRVNTELLVLVTPTIVDTLAQTAPTPPQPQVNQPLNNLNIPAFDKGLPDATNKPGK